MQVTIEEINGKPYTVVWYNGSPDEGWEEFYFFSTKYGYQIIPDGFGDSISIATALPPLPLNPKPEDAGLLYRYWSEGLVIRGKNWNEFEGEHQDSAVLPPAYDSEITHAIDPSGNRVEVAITEGEG